MEQRDILKINRQLLLLTRQMANDSDAAELMTGLSKPVIDKIATLDMEEIEELAETVGVSLYTLRFSDPVFTRLLQLPRDARSTYAEATLAGNSRGGATFPEELENHRIAHELVRLKLRLPIVNHLTQIHIKPLRLRWRVIHAESPPNGRLPESVRPFIVDALSAAELASFAAVYQRLGGADDSKVSASMLLRAREVHLRIAHREIDINAAYFAVRDVRAKIVEWRRCGRCQTYYIFDINEFHARYCPYCELSSKR